MSYPPYGGGGGYPQHPQYPQYPQPGAPGAVPNQPPNPTYGFAPPPQQPYPSYPSGNAPAPYPYPASPQQPHPQPQPQQQQVYPPTSYQPNPSQGGYPSASVYPSYPGATSGGYPQAYQQAPTSASGYPPPPQHHQHQQQQPTAASAYPPLSQHQPQHQPQSPYSYPTASVTATATTSVSHEPPKMGTVVEFNPFYPEEDAKQLRKAMKGFGTDEKAIIDILAKRTNAQRQNIAITYKTHFGRDLIQDLKSELSGRFEDVTIALMTPTYDYLANRIHKAISGLGTDEEAIIDILCGASNQQIREINAAYLRLYRKPMEKDLIADTSGHFRKLLVSLSMGNRNENPTPDPGRAAQDAQALYQAGVARWGTDEALFNSILVAQHFNQVRLVCSEYQRISGKSLENSIKSEFSGYVETGLLAIVKCAQSTPAYYAERLYRSMAGAGTDDRTLIRIVAVRSEIDMVQIKQEFQRMYGKTLESFIAGDTSGDYKKVLLGLVQ